MLYLFAHSITRSSLTDPPGCAIYLTPLLWALSMLSENGKNASDPRVTSVFPASHAFFSSLVNTGGLTLKMFCHWPSRSTSSYSSPIYTSMALSLLALPRPSTNWRERTCGDCLRYQLSAFCPASLVQWILLC